ncbi:hypothetical protein M5K25_004052 [Dendrobium thyrsiflorum]|uniref:Uncharacterized protein n=1 Tax=Dendrobium thyrsiflorum TaxID=117978 RepID=A0ABD0VT38_DENTH
MAAKKVDALEERLEGEMNQIKETVEERMSSMEGQVADLRDMMKKMLEFQTQSAASDAKGPEAKNINSEIHRKEEEVEIVEGRRGRPHLEPLQREERGGGYGERQGYGGMEPRGVGWEHREGYYGRRGAVFEDRRGDFEGGMGNGRAREDRETTKNKKTKKGCRIKKLLNVSIGTGIKKSSIQIKYDGRDPNAIHCLRTRISECEEGEGKSGLLEKKKVEIESIRRGEARRASCGESASMEGE